MRSSTRLLRGLTLIEGLAALLVLSLSLAAAVRLQAWLRLQGDIARERSEAMRHAQQDLELLRHLATPAELDAWSSRRDSTEWSTTRYTLERSVAEHAGLKTSLARVSWTARGEGDQRVQLQGSVARLSPMYSAALALPTQDHLLAARARLPSGARPWPDGRQVLKPGRASTVAWILDGATGEVLSRCEAPAGRDTGALREADLRQCETFRARLLWGYVRFSLGPLPDAWAPNDTPLPLSMHAGSTPCDTESSLGGADRYVAYTCAVPLDTPAEVSALQLVPRGWAWADSNDVGYRACRYAGLPPAAVNFVVVRGDAVCPRTVPPHNGDPVVTVQHQP
jgi:Tfp pilus assembly protein PilV